MLSEVINNSLIGILGAIPKRHEVEIVKNEQLGDYASNIAFILSKKERKSPKVVAEFLAESLKGNPNFSSVQVGGDGFLNFKFSLNLLHKELKNVLKEGFGEVNLGNGEKVILEFISANPTGPLSVVQARAGAYGNALANLLRKVNYFVHTEYYINDCGTQVELLYQSLLYRVNELKNIKSEFPQDGYPGEYLKIIAQEIIARDIKKEKWREWLLEKIIEGQKESISKFGIHFNSFVKESTIIQLRDLVLEKLKEKGLVYEKEGAIFFKTTSLGDSEDRVLVTKDSRATYFLNDLAYHYDKLNRGFDVMINIWGPDHHGYIKRMAGGIKSLGFPLQNFIVIITQQVSLEREKEKVKMSKRSGEFITLDEVLEEVGADPLKFFLLLRRPSQHLTFDLSLAKQAAKENPYYYVQYAYVRAASLKKYAESKHISFNDKIDLSLLRTPEERRLIIEILRFPDVIKQAAATFSPHLLVYYGLDLAEKFHYLYEKERIVSSDLNITKARLYLSECVKKVLKTVLEILGIKLLEKM